MIGSWPSQFHFHCLLMLSLVITLAVGQQVPRTARWCVAKKEAPNPELKKAMDWACGPGGADCSEIQPGGPCYDLSNYLKMASFVFNNYYQKYLQQDHACNFNNNAVVTFIDPSQGTCLFPAEPRSIEEGNTETWTSVTTTKPQELENANHSPAATGTGANSAVDIKPEQLLNV